jgi:hypothetical protein
MNNSDNLPFSQGSHNGYFTLSEKVLHRRTIGLLEDQILIVFDEIIGECEHKFESYLHFHSDFKFKDDSLIAIRQNFNVLIFPFGTFQNIKKYRGQKNPLQGWYSPEFGTHLPNWVLSFEGRVQLPVRLGFCLIPVEKTASIDDYSLKHTYQNERFYLSIKIKGQNYSITCSPQGMFIQ